MMLQWSLKAREGRHFFWTAFCVLSLLAYRQTSEEKLFLLKCHNMNDGEDFLALCPSDGNKVADQVSGNDSTTIPTALSSGFPTIHVPTTAFSSHSAENSTASINGTASSTVSLDNSNATSNSTDPTSAKSNLTVTTQLSTTGNSTFAHINETTTSPLIPTAILPYVSTEQPRTFSVLPTTAQDGDSSTMGNITCLNIRQVTSSQVICLKLNETYSCQQFKEKKGEHFKNAICEKKANQCDIKLADSELKKECILLVEVNKKGAHTLDALLQKQSALKELGIHYEKQAIENHKSYTRKTLIALVTSGLLLAFLGLAGYCLMKRRSWSPMGERLGEDPYYTENGSHGNTVISVASHEQSDLQDKPNLNGGTRENGTGQPASKNGQSCKPHVVADTEL